MKKLILSISLYFAVLTVALAQGNLRQMQSDFGTAYQQNFEAAKEIASQRGLPTKITLRDGRPAFLNGIENGQLIYITNYNKEAAITTGAVKIGAGGTMKLELEGEGMKVGVVEIGDPQYTHIELAGRISRYGNSSSSNDRSTRDHATHVAGTVAAEGINSSAKGMAPKAEVVSMTAAGDLKKMAEQAELGLLLSNHSYGSVRGWSGDTWYGDESVSLEADYLFGFYNSRARDIDKLAFSAPNYLIVWAAGNDRGEGPSSGSVRPEVQTRADGPYDCLPPETTAKNTLTVGAVKEVLNYNDFNSVEMSDFSSWGPTDDGRIKPDVVANGVNVLSPVAVNSSFELSDSTYATQQGTSMAAPNATGSLLLIQELYALENKGAYMRAATLKGLAIHTTRQAGAAEGPTYSHGYGLLAVDRAAHLVQNTHLSSYQIKEGRLEQGATVTYQLESDGNNPVLATLAWTDPAGTSPEKMLNPRTPVLVNNLDVTVKSPSGSTVFAWSLDPETPSRKASRTAKNNVDNNEKIEILNPEAGTYTVEVSHQGDLLDGAGQDYSLIMSSGALEEQRTVLYWVKGDGEWSDGDHWSDRSGGDAINTIPDENTDVVIDQKSGTPTVLLNGSPTARSLTIEAGTLNMDTDLLLTGALILKGDGAITNSGTIDLTASAGTLINLNVENEIEEASLNLRGFDQSVWNIKGKLTAKSLLLGGGRFNMNDIEAQTLEVTSQSTETEMRAEGSWSISNRLALGGVEDADLSGVEVNFSNASDQSASLALGGAQLGTVSSSVPLTLIGTASGNGQIGVFDAQDDLTIEGEVSIDDLQLTAGTMLAIGASSTLTVTENMTATGASDQLISLVGEGNDALIYSDARRFCMDYLQIDDLDVAGNAVFAIGKNSQLNSGSGWIEKDCDELIFAEMDVDYACAEGVAKLTSMSSGAVSKTVWTISKDDYSETVEGQSVDFVFPEMGEYDVTLSISNENGERDTFTEKVWVVENDIVEKPLIRTSGYYITQTVGSQYDWFIDGQLIPDYNEGFFQPEGDINDIQLYVVDDGCRVKLGYEVALSADDLSEVKLYPNPAHSTATVALPANATGVSIILSDISGRKIQEINGLAERYHQINLAGFPAGVYLVEVKTANASKVIRLLKN
ncbi:S8 family serine peptidase [Persicobacter psychrovividus]|uniref:Uncharacterized protein n=1 Tax=Persicobacter psychrovividus TaxID=387638 RepID=A0ABM7VBG1_9BACT|nr:hypothetical protein PEPS_05510 [Persicobacter psychrovividus]